MFTALAMPMLIGFAGLAVDLSQWYMWKRELQFAIDQAAIAGAFAYSDSETSADYQTHAQLEYESNIGVVGGFDATPTISLVDWDSGSLNAISVTGSVSRILPFSSLFMRTPTNVSATAWATFEGGNGTVYTSCIIALNPTAAKAVNFHGGPTVQSQCGLTSLSTASNSININGNSGSYDVGFVLSAGGISDGHDHFSGLSVTPNMSGLSDPYENLTPPDNPTARSLSCASTSSTYTADVTTTSSTTYDYFKGANANNASPYNHSPQQADTSGSSTAYDQTFSSSPNNSSDSSENWIQLSGNGRNRIWERVTTVTAVTYSNIQEVGGSSGSMQPGTYQDFTVNCDTVLQSGIYVIDGGDLDVNAQDSLTGSGVMFVLKNGAGIKINGGASIQLTGMSEGQLISAGVAADDAAEMAGMLIFEDRTSSGNSQNKINGNSGLSLSGIIYLPSSPISLLGTMQGVSRCLSIAADEIEIGGTADLANLCPAGVDPDPVVYQDRDQIRLVH